jgi:hypothetical protein
MRRKQQLVGLLVLTVALAAVVPTLAQGRPMPSVSGNDQVHYSVVSGGGPVDDRNVPRATPVDPRPAQIASSGGTVDDRNVSRATPVDPAPIVIGADGGTSIDFGNPAYAALALMLGLLAGGAAVAVWYSRKLTPA